MNNKSSVRVCIGFGVGRISCDFDWNYSLSIFISFIIMILIMIIIAPIFFFIRRLIYVCLYFDRIPIPTVPHATHMYLQFNIIIMIILYTYVLFLDYIFKTNSFHTEELFQNLLILETSESEQSFCVSEYCESQLNLSDKINRQTFNMY